MASLRISDGSANVQQKARNAFTTTSCIATKWRPDQKDLPNFQLKFESGCYLNLERKEMM